MVPRLDTLAREVGEIWIEREGARLFGVEEGHGSLLVFLHGGLADHRACHPYVAALTGPHRVLTPDVRGSGRSHDAGPLDFDLLADDLVAWLDHLGEERAVVGGVSSGSGLAVRFALRHQDRTAGLIVVMPVYAGRRTGFTTSQEESFAGMDAVASRVLDEGIDALLPLYARLPEGMRERAVAMAAEFDPASVVATSSFVASGAQPFEDRAELAGLSAPTLLVAGDDPQHPAEVSELYRDALPRVTVRPATVDPAAEIAAFCAELDRSRSG